MVKKNAHVPPKAGKKTRLPPKLPTTWGEINTGLGTRPVHEKLEPEKLTNRDFMMASDRIAVAEQYFHTFVTEHPAISQNNDLLVLANTIDDAMGAFYQAVVDKVTDEK